MSAFEKHSLPNSPAQITPALLMPILCSAGVLQRATITAITIEPLAAMASFNAQLVRLHLTYDQYEATAPRSLIAKLPTLNTALHQNAAVFRPGLKECWFYRRGVARTPLNVPRCYYNAVDPAMGESLLLLEDLAPARTGHRLEGTSLAEAELALQSLARLHAAWWAIDPAAEPELDQLMDNAQEEENLVEQLYREGWPQFLERADLDIPDDIRQFGECLVGRIAATEALLDSSPQTLIHGDYRLENMLFGRRDGQPICWVIDWEDLMLGNGMYDVAWFLGGGLPVEQSDKEEQLLRCYHQVLTDAGVEGYPLTQCHHDYRGAMVSSFVQGILTVVSLETNDNYEVKLARVLAERFMMACRRLRLHELIPS